MTIYIILSAFLFWLIILTWSFYKLKHHYTILLSNTKNKSLDDVLDNLLKKDGELGTSLDNIKAELTKQIQQSQSHIQKIGLVRFNPFERTAGEQSFVISLLNQKDSGLVINFIYTKEGLRAYTKKVIQGKGDKYDLSEEEKLAIKESN
ncbi:MAG: hypothetical protein US11_C0001G0050 [Candidatus Roizmanbacteria bacterium GW2011_GWA2_36_23]|uniref:DUF4446 domain-containing protein n=1 Tax=Candidatus Roizmanbacteria bacterium GW2011_GWA2_36_23 TaxID=1618480 RepID=A0A0G0HDW0_9BACT|nr:MAG: hypothetical protein US11_C0001G0050 [Candidatus Roizmanbacteria bacterium GW2011_GWA2_36_23]